MDRSSQNEAERKSKRSLLYRAPKKARDHQQTTPSRVGLTKAKSFRLMKDLEAEDKELGI